MRTYLVHFAARHRQDLRHVHIWAATGPLTDLKVVCRQFRQLLSSNPQIPVTSVLCSTALDAPGLLSWLRTMQHCGYLTGVMDGSLDSLLHLRVCCWFARLRGISLACANCSSLTSLCCSITLAKCKLHMPSEDVLDIQALAKLNSLKILVLKEGRSHNLQLSSSLTTLLQHGSHVTCTHMDKNALLQMVISEESELCLPSSGLAACPALTRLLVCFDSAIKAADPDDSYEIGHAPPAAMSQLLCLTRVTVSVVKDKVDLRLHLILDGTTPYNRCPVKLEKTGKIADHSFS